MADGVIIMKRFTFRCWQCKETYTIFRQVDLEQKLEVSCPYCGAKADVDFRPYHKRQKTVFRTAEEAGIEFGDYQLPKILPTNQP